MVLSFSALESGQDDEPDQEENQHREVDEDGHLTPLPLVILALSIHAWL